MACRGLAIPNFFYEMMLDDDITVTIMISPKAYLKYLPILFSVKSCNLIVLKNLIIVPIFSASGYLHQISTGHLILQKQNFVVLINISKEINQ